MAGSFSAEDPLTQLAFALAGGRGAFALLLGSGLSRSAEIPTGWEITLDLVRRLAATRGVTGEQDWAKWYFESVGEELSYSRLLAALAKSPVERRAILESYIEPDEQDVEEGRKQPTAAHRAIADLVADGVVRVVITTNFDRLIENAIRDRGVEPTVISSVDALLGAEPISHAQCYVLKLHGDYKDTRILNTDKELSGYPKAYNVLLARILDEYGLLVSGWSGEWDVALRDAIRRTPNRRYPMYWSVRGKLGESASELTALRGAIVIPVADADSFFSTLVRHVQTIRTSRRENPRSVALLVNSAKRFLAKPEFRIPLAELVADEGSKLLTELGRDSYSPDGNWDVAAFQGRVARYESATEGLAKIVGVLGRWGDQAQFSLVLDLIRGLYADAERIGSGLSAYLNIRGYPAVLVFTAYGLGLVRASQWPLLHRLFRSEFSREYRDPIAIVPALFLFGWKGGQNDYWRHLEGLDRRKTALSDHLLDTFRTWSDAFVDLEPEFELLFERFEMLASLADFERNEKANVIKALEADRPDSWIWMSVGRSGWHESTATRIVRELRNDEFVTAITKAGFGRGDRDYVDLFLKNFERFTSRMRW